MKKKERRRRRELPKSHQKVQGNHRAAPPNPEKMNFKLFLSDKEEKEPEENQDKMGGPQDNLLEEEKSVEKQEQMTLLKEDKVRTSENRTT